MGKITTIKAEHYELDELIKILEDIYKNSDGIINIPKALYTLAILMKQLKLQIEVDVSTSSK